MDWFVGLGSSLLLCAFILSFSVYLAISVGCRHWYGFSVSVSPGAKKSRMPLNQPAGSFCPTFPLLPDLVPDLAWP